MPVEQHTGTPFSDGDQLDFHQGRHDLRRVEEIQHTVRVGEEKAPEELARERAKAQSAEFFQTLHGQIKLMAELSVNLRREAADNAPKPLDSRRDLGTKQDYELIG